MQDTRVRSLGQEDRSPGGGRGILFSYRLLQDIELGSLRYIVGPCWLFIFYITAAKSLQSCPTLCDPIDGSPLGSTVPGILQARTPEWVAISFFNAWKWKVKGKSLSRVRLLTTPWTAAYQAPPSMGFSRQEYWSGVPLPSPSQQLNEYKMRTNDSFTSKFPSSPLLSLLLFSPSQKTAITQKI